MGVLKDTAGPLITGGLNLLGGALGAAAQNKANKINLQIARETNQANRVIALGTNLMTQSMMREQLKYSSPKEQRRMLEEAGYNPFLYGSQQAFPAGSPSASTGAPQVAPTVQPVDSFARSISALSQDSAAVFNTLAQGRKANAEATEKNIDNITKADINAAQLEGMGLSNTAQSIRNERDAALSPLQVENQRLENEHISRMNQVLELEKGLKQFDLDFLSPAQYNKLVEETRLLGEQIITQDEYRKHLQRMDSYGRLNAVANYMDAKTRQMIAPSQMAQNYALVKYYDASAGKEEQMRLNYVEITKLNNLASRMKKTENEIYQEYARFNAWYDYNILRNKSQMSEYDVKIEYQQYLMNKKHLNWYDAKQVSDMLIPIKYGSGQSGNNIRGQKPIWEDLENRETPTAGKDGMLNYGDGVFEDSRGWIYNANTREWIKPTGVR